MADEVSDQFDPRARIYHADGTETPVRRQDIHGLDEWGENWAQNPLLPSPMSFSAWQMTDEEHPGTEGDAGHRIVYKTIRTIFAPPHELDAGNLLVRWGNDEITWGETRYPNALAHRREGEWVGASVGQGHLARCSSLVRD